MINTFSRQRGCMMIVATLMTMLAAASLSDAAPADAAPAPAT